MAMELIDGFAGEPHIDSDDLAALNIGCFGEGDHVLAFGDRFEASMTSSNQVSVGTGALVHAGRRAVNLSAQSLTVQSGTQGQMRNDLVVARYAKASGTNVESMDLAVVKGTPVSYGTAADPDTTDDEMPLWRIPLDGINPGTPVQLFDELPTIDSLRDSLSQERIGNNEGDSFWAERIGPLVVVSISSLQLTVEAWQVAVVWRLPEAYRPKRTWSAACSCSLGTSGARMEVQPSGEVKICAAAASINGEYICAEVVYPVKSV